MRIKLDKIPQLEAKQGAIRTIEKFLWVPVIIKNEIRWLETVKIIQQYDVCFVHRHEHIFSNKTIRYPVGFWINKEFVGSTDSSVYLDTYPIEINSNEK